MSGGLDSVYSVTVEKAKAEAETLYTWDDVKEHPGVYDPVNDHYAWARVYSFACGTEPMYGYKNGKYAICHCSSEFKTMTYRRAKDKVTITFNPDAVVEPKLPSWVSDSKTHVYKDGSGYNIRWRDCTVFIGCPGKSAGKPGTLYWLSIPGTAYNGWTPSHTLDEVTTILREQGVIS